jgi:hypothetical protein
VWHRRLAGAGLKQPLSREGTRAHPGRDHTMLGIVTELKTGVS